MDTRAGSVIALSLFDSYNNYKRQTLYYRNLRSTRPYLKELKATPPRLQLFEEMAQWCKERDILPNQWLYTLFAARYWKFPPKLERAHLMSVKHISKFHKFKNWDAYTTAQNKVEEPIFDPNKDISNAVESLKKHYLENGQADICFQEMKKTTYGYHPLSKVCVDCGIKDQCLDKLRSSVKFDILALRRGEIVTEDARQLALLGVLDYDNR